MSRRSSVGQSHLDRGFRHLQVPCRDASSVTEGVHWSDVHDHCYNLAATVGDYRKRKVLTVALHGWPVGVRVSAATIGDYRKRESGNTTNETVASRVYDGEVWQQTTWVK